MGACLDLVEQDITSPAQASGRLQVVASTIARLHTLHDEHVVPRYGARIVNHAIATGIVAPAPHRHCPAKRHIEPRRLVPLERNDEGIPLAQ